MIREGDLAPEFMLPATTGTVSLTKLRDRGRLIVLFYSEDATPLCARELQPFVADHTTILELDASVVAISADDVESHRRFAEKLAIPFPLLSDPDGRVAREWGVFDESSRQARRAIFVVSREGRVLHANPHHSPTNASEYEAAIVALTTG